MDKSSRELSSRSGVQIECIINYKLPPLSTSLVLVVQDPLNTLRYQSNNLDH